MLARKELEDIDDILRKRLNDIEGGIEFVLEEGGPNSEFLYGVQLKERVEHLISAVKNEMRV